jgi:dTDP-4-amino-4,6-dideoxygalactose transaminase
MIHYPVPPHLQNAYKDLKYSIGSFPIAEEIASTCLSLPMGPHLDLKDIETVSNEIINFFNNKQ